MNLGMPSRRSPPRAATLQPDLPCDTAVETTQRGYGGAGAKP